MTNRASRTPGAPGGALDALVAAAARAGAAAAAALVRPSGERLELLAARDDPKTTARALRGRPVPADWRGLRATWHTADPKSVLGSAGNGLDYAAAWPAVPGAEAGWLVLLGNGEVPSDDATLGALARAAWALAVLDEPGSLPGRSLDAAGAGVTIADARAPDMPLVYANAGFLEMTGYDRDQVIGTNCRFLQGEQHDQPGVREVRRSIEAVRECTVLLRNYRRDGTAFWNEFHLAPLMDADGGVSHFIGIQHDVTEREELRARIEHERAEYRKVIGEAPNGIMVLGDAGRVRFANAAAERMLGAESGGLEGTHFELPEDDERRPELAIRRPSGPDAGNGSGIAELTVTAIEWEGQPAWMAILHDVTERRRAEHQAERMAYTDTLTGLANRDRLQEHLDGALANAAGPRGRVGLILLDMDRFKEINDSLGHQAGDEFLVQVARRLEWALRDTDLVARIGGDEFAVLLDSVPDMEAARTVGDKIVGAFGEALQLGDRRLVTSASVGVSLYPDDADSAEALMKHADAAMYAAKGAGGGAVSVFHGEFVERAERRLELDQALGDALARGEFVVHYQPQVHLGDETRLAGLEALVRWNHPERGLLGPGEFIEQLEELDLIGELTHHVLDVVCGQLAHWGDRLPEEASIAVNLSARELRGDDLASRLGGIIAQHGVSACSISLELTESAAALDIVQAMHMLGDLRARGARVALDDFGKGYSALNYLRVLPIDTVKVDRDFVRDLPDDAASGAMLRAIVQMAHGIGKRVLAEGVETRAQADFLRGLGCDFAQGFLFGRPVPAEHLDPGIRPRAEDDAAG